ncbi:hypothetical protein BROUX41_004350 [Berkeleyomyces rouxiae]
MGFFRFLKRDRPPTAAAAAAISSEQYFKGKSPVHREGAVDAPVAGLRRPRSSAVTRTNAWEPALAAKDVGSERNISSPDLDARRQPAALAGDQLLPPLKLNALPRSDAGDQVPLPLLPSPPSTRVSFDVGSKLPQSPATSSFPWRTPSISRPMSRKSKRFSTASIGTADAVPAPADKRLLPAPDPVFDNHPAVKPLASSVSPPHSHKRNSSTLGSAQRTNRAFVDVLDAQSVIKHSNLLSRVQATGVRDYGEDVADRNNAGNSFAISTALPYAHLAVPAPPLRPSSSRESTGRMRRSGSIESSRLRPATAISHRDRRAVSDYAISDSASIISQHRLTAFHSSVMPSSPSASPRPNRPWARDLVDASQLELSPRRGQSPSSSVINRVQAWNRDSQEGQSPEQLRGKHTHHRLASRSPRPSTPDKPADARSSPANLVDTITAGFGNIDFRDSFDAELPESLAAPSPQVLRRSYRTGSTTDLLYSPHRGPLAHDDEPEDFGRPHSSMARHWSVSSSTTPTNSSLHSSSAPRPRTSYTENTSIEVPATPDQRMLAALLTRHSSRDATSAYYMQQAQSGALKAPAPYAHDAAPHAGARLDKRSLEQVDSEVYASEENLLFRDNGFGLAGLQLPGLFETIPEIPPDSPPRHLSLASAPSSHYPHAARGRRYQSAIAEEDPDHFADFDYEHDPFPPLPPYGTRRPNRAPR